MWFYFPAKNVYPILKGPDYVIIISSQKSISIWGELTMWLYFPAKNISHSEGNWLCDYTFQPKTYLILRVLAMWLYPKEWNL